MILHALYFDQMFGETCPAAMTAGTVTLMALAGSVRGEAA